MCCLHVSHATGLGHVLILEVIYRHATIILPVCHKRDWGIKATNRMADHQIWFDFPMIIVRFQGMIQNATFLASWAQQSWASCTLHLHDAPIRVVKANLLGTTSAFNLLTTRTASCKSSLQLNKDVDLLSLIVITQQSSILSLLGCALFQRVGYYYRYCSVSQSASSYWSTPTTCLRLLLPTRKS